jgi:putative ABC transport system permease protein
MTRGGSGARSILRRLRIGFLPVLGQALGLAVLVAVLAASLVSVPLMTGSAEEGAWVRERARHAEAAIGTTLFSSSVPGNVEPQRGRVLNAADLDDAVVGAATTLGLPRPVSLARLRDPLFTDTPTGPVRIVLTSRTGAEERLDVVAGDVGVLANGRLAELAGVAPGSTVVGVADTDVSTELTVTGVYADPAVPLDPYWGGLENLFIEPPAPDTDDPVFPTVAVFTSREQVLATADEVGEDVVLEWYLPLPPGIDVDEARRTADRLDRLLTDLRTSNEVVVRVTALFGFDRATAQGELRDALGQVDETVTLLRPPVRAVGTGAGAAGLVLVGAWAGQRARRREDELRALLARGHPPHRAAGAALREAVLPTVVGLAAGGAAGWLLVRALGPSPLLPDGTAATALWVLGAAGVAALLTVAAVTALLVVRLDALGGRPGAFAGRIPWLAVTAAVTVATAVPVVTGEADGGGIDLLQLVLPLLATAVVAGAVTAVLPRLAGRGAGRGGGRLRRLPPVPSLALSRVLTGRAAARLVVMTTALSLGLVVYSGALADSVDRTVAAKQAVATGGDVVVPLLRRIGEAGPLPSGTTVVGAGGRAALTTEDRPVDVLVVRPEEFLAVARWDPALAGSPPEELMAALAGHRGGGVPVVVAGTSRYDVGTELAMAFGRVYSMQLEVVATADAFPGQPDRTPVVVADWDRFAEALTAAGRDPEAVLDRQVWARGEAGPLLEELTAARYAFDPDQVRTRAGFAGRPELGASSWAFGYLRAIALAAGLLGLTGVAMHALAQQRRRTVAALLLRRMGMRRRALDAATALETGVLTGLGALVAVAVALPASALLLPLLDPVPALSPAPVLAVPWGSLAAVVTGVLAVTAVTAVLVGRAARADDPGTVLRAAP